VRLGGRCAWPIELDDKPSPGRRNSIDLIPAQVHQLGRPEPVAEGQEDHYRVPVACGGLDQPLDGEIFRQSDYAADAAREAAFRATRGD
jgi:hypothetical protein